MAITTIEAEGVHEWRARPNCSLNPSARQLLIGGVLFLSLLVSGGFLVAGAWLVLPFAGVELAVLYIALRILDRRDQSSETVRLEGSRLSIVSHLPGGDIQHDFNTGWARLSLEADTASGPDPLICIRSHGRCCQVGHLMTPEQRYQFYTDLSRRLRS